MKKIIIWSAFSFLFLLVGVSPVFATPIPTAPSAPTALTPTPGNTQVGLTWTAPADGGSAITDYKVEYQASNGVIYVANYSSSTILKSTDGGTTWTDTTNGGAFSGPFGITTDSSNTIYVANYYNDTILKSTDGGASWTDTTNSGAFSSPSSITTDSLNNIYVANYYNDTILKSTDGGASWTDTTNSGAFSSPYAVGASKWLTFSDGTSTTASATVTGLTNGTLYDFRIKATNAVGTGSPSSVASSTPVVASFILTYTAGTGGTITGLPPRFQFKKDLKPKVTHDDIKTLQIFLNANGFIVAKSGAGSKGHETNYFGQKTKQALMKFQQAHTKDILTPLGLNASTGILDQNSRKVINAWIAGAQQ